MRKVMIVGGGLIGVSSAYELQRSGFEVTLFEASDALARGTSYANGGLLSASMPEPWNSPGVGRALLSSLTDPYSAMKLHPRALPGLVGWGLRFLRLSTPAAYRQACADNFPLTRFSVDTTLELAAALNLDFDQRSVGILKIFDHPASLQNTKRGVAALHNLGLRAERLSADECVAQEPALDAIRGRIYGGLLFPDDHSGDARRFTQGLGDALRRGGGHMHHGERLVDIHVSGGAITGMTTSRDHYACDTVVIATGVDSPKILRKLGVHMPVQPAKGYSLSIPVDGLEGSPRTPVVDEALHVAITPLGNQLRVAGTAEFMGHDRTLESHRVDNLHNVFGKMYPELAPHIRREDCTAWTGLRPMTYDGKPRIGPVGPNGLFVNTGHGALGWTMASGSARLLAALIEGTKPPLDPGPFRP